MEMDGTDGWHTVLQRELDGNGAVDAAFVNIVTHAPMDRRLRNELINRGYARLANRLTEILRRGRCDAAAPMPPNFFCFAHWASSYVGTRMETRRGRLIGAHLENGNAVVFHSMSRAFLAFEREVTLGESASEARRVIDRAIPAAARVNSDVDPLLDVEAGAAVASLVDPTSGLPAALLAEVDPESACGAGELLARIRRRGFEEYLRAIATSDRHERDDAILRGNAWLVVSEQAMVDPALTRAMRSLIRTTLAPVASLRRSRRTQRNERVGPVRHGLEDAWIELMSRTLEWPTPKTVLPDAAPLWFRPNGAASVHRWLQAAPRALPRGAPFDHFSMPDPAHGPLFWTALRHRLPVIFAVLGACHEGDWFDQGALREHAPWPDFEAAVGAQARAFGTRNRRSSDPSDVRRNDWATAKRLFDRDRELILAALFTRSLPATYTSPAGAALLDLRAHALAPCPARPTRNALADDSLPRLRASASFLEAMFVSLLPPGLECTATHEGRTKLEWLNAVEQVHDHVRRRIAAAVNDRRGVVPDATLFDDPLGYDQCIGAGVSFVVPVIETLNECYGVFWSEGERDSWARVWAEITLHQGLDTVLKRLECDDHLGWGPESKPCLSDFSYGDFAVAASVLRSRDERRSLSGVRLADKLRRDLEDAVPPLMRPLIRIGFDVFGDRRVNRLLLLPESRLAAPAARVARALPPLTRAATRGVLRIVLRELGAAVEEGPWDARFSPGFDPRVMLAA